MKNIFLILLFAILVVTTTANNSGEEIGKKKRLASSSSKSFLGKFKHVIVLMLENRCFDHFFGFSKPDLDVNSLSGKEFNYENVKDFDEESM